MGSPVSPIVANLVMEDIERKALDSFQKSPPRIWKRYVDDTFVIVNRKVASEFFQHINSIETSIQFTREDETDGGIAFLDVRVSRTQTGNLQTSVYRKATHSDRYLNFRSDHPTQHKKAVLSSLMNRAEVLCSSEEERRKDRSHVKNACLLYTSPSPRDA